MTIQTRLTGLFLVLAAAANAESIWTVNTAKVRPGMMDKAVLYYQAAWLPARQEALKHGYIRSFRLLAAPKKSDSEAEFVLITEFDSEVSFASRENNFQKIFQEQKTTLPVRVGGLGRGDIFEYVNGLEDYQEIRGAGSAVPAVQTPR